MRGKGVARSCAYQTFVFFAFFALLIPQKKQKMQKLAIIGYFVDILGSTSIRLVKYSAELVYINHIGSRSGILWLLLKLNQKI